MTTSCYFCKGKVVPELTTVDFRWGNELKIIENVPAEMCQQCGEKYLDAQVYRELERLAQGSNHAGHHVSVEVLRYSAA
jgi:YgiT-type zinc finger domain-containing protein